MPNNTNTIGAVAIGVVAVAAGFLKEMPRIREAYVDRKVVRNAFMNVVRKSEDPTATPDDVMNERHHAYYLKYSIRNAKKT